MNALADNSCRLELEPTYYASSLVLQGEAHRRARTNGQDHAVVRRSEAGIILVVADGVSLTRDEVGVLVSSRCEVGSWIAAEVAAKAALVALDGGTPIDDLMGPVSVALVDALGPIWAALEMRAKQALCSTLLVACVTAAGTRVWASGDGAWGVLLPQGAERRRLTIQHLTHIGRGGASGGRELKGFSHTATTETRHNAGAVAAELDLVLKYDGPVLAVHIATDGIYDEPEARQFTAQHPVRSKPSLEALLKRPNNCDDLAIAWVATRWPGLLGEEVADA